MGLDRQALQSLSNNYRSLLNIVKVWDFRIDLLSLAMFIDNGLISSAHDNSYLFRELIAKNNGLSECVFIDWFVPSWEKFKGFDEQIICWDKSIDYLTTSIIGKPDNI